MTTTKKLQEIRQCSLIAQALVDMTTEFKVYVTLKSFAFRCQCIHCTYRESQPRVVHAYTGMLMLMFVQTEKKKAPLPYHSVEAELANSLLE